MKWAVLWWASAVFMGLAAAPITLRLFPSFRGRGYASAKAVGLALVALLSWLMASLHILPFGLLSVWFSVMALVAGSVLLERFSGPLMAEYFRKNWRHVVLVEALFTVVFAVFVFQRALHPDIIYQEKFMDLAFLNSLLRADYLPSQDMWLSGEPVNYYYFGYFTYATLTRLTGVPVEYAYNLSIALIPALAFTTIFALCAELTGSALWGGLGGVLAVFMGNFNGFVQIVRGAGFRGFNYFESSRVVANTINEFPFFSFFHADLHPHVMAVPFAMVVLTVSAHCVFAGRRGWCVFGEGLTGGLRLVAYGALFGCLQMMNPWDGPPYAMIVGLCILYGAEQDSTMVRVQGVRLLRAAGGVGAILGCGVVFSLPFLIHFHSQFLGIGVVHASTTFGELFTVFGIFLVLVASYAVAECGETVRGLKGSFLVPPLLAVTYGAVLQVAFVNVTISIVGALLVYVVAALLVGARRAPGLAKALLPLVVAALLCMGVLFLFRLSQGYGAMWAVGGVVAGVGGLVLVVLFARGASPSRVVATVVVMTALTGLLLCEVLFLKDNYGYANHRMNTVFKAYFQAWFFLAVGGTWFLYRTVDIVFAAVRRVLNERRAGELWRRAAAVSAAAAWVAFVGFMLASGLCYPVATTGQRLLPVLRGAKSLTLDGMEYLRKGHTGDYAGIQWLRRNVKGQAVVLEAQDPTKPYSYFARISVNSGLPTVLGWANHQRVWRVSREGDPYQETYHKRVEGRGRDVDLIYQARRLEDVEDLIRRYRIQYIFFGELERERYGLEGLAKFEAHFEKVFSDAQTGTAIYRVVNHRAHPAA